jgi:hypothetical protein
VEEYQRARQKDQQRRTSIPPAKPAKQAATKKPPRRLSESPVDAEVIDRPGESVAAHVAKHLQNEAFDQRAAHMTDDLAKADREREEHHRKVFSHNLGRLAKPAVAAAETSDEGSNTQAAAASSTATALAGLLTTPQNIRQAIILNEILQRPADRW